MNLCRRVRGRARLPGLGRQCVQLLLRDLDLADEIAAVGGEPQCECQVVRHCRTGASGWRDPYNSGYLSTTYTGVAW